MYNRQNKTNSLIEAGLIVSLMIVLIMANLYLPILAIFISFLLPIPITVLYLRQDYKITLWAIIVTGVITSMIQDPITAVTTTISFGTMGFLLGYCIEKQKSIFITIVILAFGFLLSRIIQISIYFMFIDNRGIVKIMNESKKIMQQSIEFYSNIGIPKEQIQQMEQTLAYFKPDLILKMLPSILIMSSFLSAVLNYFVSKKVLMKLGYKNIKPLPHISKIHVNVRLVTIVAIGLLIGAILKRKGIELGDYFFITSDNLIKILFLINGISTAIYYMRNKFKISKGILIFILLMTSSPIFSLIYIYLGLIDIMFDFRKLDSFRGYNDNKSGEL